MIGENYYTSSELEDNIYCNLIKNKKAEVEFLSTPPKDITSFMREEDEVYYYGLCDYEIKSTSFKKKCPFDRRTHRAVVWDDKKSDGMTCRKYCSIEDFKISKNIKKMNDVPIEHREKLRQLIKYKILDFIPKV